MRTILLLGAGKSATVLINYLLQHAPSENWQVWVVDADLALAESKTGHSPFAKALSFDIANKEERKKYITAADIVLSLLPPALHILIAKDCITYKKNFLTASYIDEAMKALGAAVAKNNLLFLCEMGLDPGIDHMSAKKLMDKIKNVGGKITSFISHCGGLVAPESDDNPWHYKISWNPRNVVMAGKAGAVFKKDNTIQSISYEAIFSENREITLPDYGLLCWYPNRDSLHYIETYGLKDCNTFIRTTLRHHDFIYGWKNIINLKLTDEQPVYDTTAKTLGQFFKEHMSRHGFDNFKDASDLLTRQLQYLGMNDTSTEINKGLCSAADVLQFALEQKLTLQPNDKDLVIMMHELEYTKEGKRYKSQSTLLLKGKNNQHTAMAATVGLPLGIATKLILNGSIQLKGLHIPVKEEIYEPVLEELGKYHIAFNETETIL